MRVLLIHNKYQQKGGEDVVYQAEGELLKEHGHIVDRLLFDNSTIKSTKDIILSGIGSLYNPKSAGTLEEKIRTFKPDIVHIHNFFPLASPSLFFKANQYHIPVVVTLHNYRLICPSYTLYHNGEIYEKSIHQKFPIDAILKGVYRDSKIQTASTVLMTGIHKLTGTWKNKINRYIVLTEFAKNKFVHSSLGVPAEQMTVKPNFTEDVGLGKEQREEFFLFIGRLTEEKGIDVLLESTKLLKYKLKIIGDGPMKEEVLRYSKSNPNIEYVGFKEKNYIIEELKRCKALIFPSVWYEGFPMTILEAFSTGTPVISSRLGGPEEIIEDRKTGLHFTAGNAQDLKDKINALDKDILFAKKLGQLARKQYEEKYTPEINYQMLISIYKDILNKNIK